MSVELTFALEIFWAAAAIMMIAHVVKAAWEILRERKYGGLRER